MRFHRTGNEFGMILHADAPPVIFPFERFGTVVRFGNRGRDETVLRHIGGVFFIERVLVAVPFGDRELFVDARKLRLFDEADGSRAELHRAGSRKPRLLFRQTDDRVSAVLYKLRAVRIRPAAQRTSRFDRHELHTQIDTQIGYIVFARIFYRNEETEKSALPVIRRHDDAVDVFERRRYLLFVFAAFERFRVDFFYINLRAEPR